MRSSSLSTIQILNAISLFIFFSLLLSLSAHVEGSARPLKDHPHDHQHSISFTAVKNFFVSRAYSGPSHRGRGHWHMIYIYIYILWRYSIPLDIYGERVNFPEFNLLVHFYTFSKKVVQEIVQWRLANLTAQKKKNPWLLQ